MLWFWIPQAFSNDSVLTHEVQASVFFSNWLIIVHEIGIFSAVLFRIIWYPSGAYTIFRYVLQLKPDAIWQILKSGLRNNSEKNNGI